MTSVILNTNNAQSMTSNEIAALTGKSHANVMRDIREMLESLGKDQINFDAIYFDSYSRAQACFKLPYDETICLLTGYDAKARMAVIKRWQELENAGTYFVPTSLSAALRLAADQSEQIEQQQAQLAIAATKVAFVDKYIESTGLRGFREVCKLLGANESHFRLFMIDKKIMYRLGNTLMPMAQHMDAGRFQVKTGTSDDGHAYNTAKFTAKGVEWVAGLWAVNGLREAA